MRLKGVLEMNHSPAIPHPRFGPALVLTVISIFQSGHAVCAEREFLSGYLGTLPSAKEDRAGTYFDRPEVRHLLASMEIHPILKTAAEKSLVSTPTRLHDLLRLHLLREDGDLVYIGFPYFTVSDMKAVHATAARYVPNLVAAFAGSQTRIDTLLKKYPVASVSRKRLAFVLIAGMSLNWDALQLLRERGYRKTAQVQGDSWQYSFWASEDLPNYSYRGFYWGSSTFPADALNLTPPLDFAFSSFGDALSDPRMNLPDLLALPPDQMTVPVREAAQQLGFTDDNELNMSLKNVIGLSRARDLGAILFAMRHGATEAKGICAEISTAQDCPAELSLLIAIGYAKSNSRGKYQLTVPVFDTADKPMLDAALSLNRDVIAHWLDANYAAIRRSLSRLSAVQQGVAYQAMFGQIWHELFGLATRELAANGLIEDPRAASVLWQGSIPMLWRTAVYHHEFQ